MHGALPIVGQHLNLRKQFRCVLNLIDDDTMHLELVKKGDGVLDGEFSRVQGFEVDIVPAREKGFCQSRLPLCRGPVRVTTG